MPGRAQCSRVLATGLWRVQECGAAAAALHRALPITAGKVIVDACQLAPITSPACGGEPAPDLIRGRIALCAMREGADAVAITTIPPPHPSPVSKSDVSDLDKSCLSAELGNTRVRPGEGGACGKAGVSPPPPLPRCLRRPQESVP